jgi:hypothetical protein
MHNLVASLLLVFCVTARAGESKCNAPPYGDTVQKFKSYVANFGQYADPSKTLPAICRMKYEGADRQTLYGLGFTDEDINSKSTMDLAVQLMDALRNLAKHTPD